MTVLSVFLVIVSEPSYSRLHNLIGSDYYTPALKSSVAQIQAHVHIDTAVLNGVIKIDEMIT